MGTSSPHSSHGRPQPGAEPQITARAGIFLGLPVGIGVAPHAGHISPALCAGLWALVWVRGSLILQQLGMLQLDRGTRGLGFSEGRKLDALVQHQWGGVVPSVAFPLPKNTSSLGWLALGVNPSLGIILECLMQSHQQRPRWARLYLMVWRFAYSRRWCFVCGLLCLLFFFFFPSVSPEAESGACWGMRC